MKHIPEHILQEQRQQAGLSQEEMAFLLGASTGSRVSRHENFRRMPNIDLAFAYVAVHQKPMHELFCGRYLRTAQEVLERARTLRALMVERQVDPRKVDIINTLIAVLETGLRDFFD